MLKKIITNLLTNRMRISVESLNKLRSNPLNIRQPINREEQDNR